MSDSSRVLIDLIVVSTFIGLVTEEVDLFKSFVLDVAQGVRLIPAVGEDIEADLSSDGVCQTKVGELLL